MKRISFLIIALISICNLAAKKVVTWDNPSVLHSTASHLKIKSIAFTDTATIVEIRTANSKHNIQFVSDTYLQGDDGKHYLIKYCKEYPLNQYLPTKDTNDLPLTLVFEPMPKKQNAVDLIEGYGLNNFKWLGVHNSKKSLKIKPFPVREDEINNFHKGFFNTDTITIRGQFEVVPNEKVASIEYYDQLSGQNYPMIISINQDGSFEKKFIADHPFIRYILIKNAIIPFVAIPGHTLNLTIHKNGKVDYSDENGNPSPFSKLLSSQALSACNYNYYNHDDELSSLNFVEMGDKMEQMADHLSLVSNYIAHRNSFSQIEFDVLHTAALFNCATAFLEFDMNKNMFSSDSICSAQSKDTKNYHILKRLDLDCPTILMQQDYYFFQNRYSFMSLFRNSWIKTNPDGSMIARTTEETDSVTLCLDKEISGMDSPSIPLKVHLLNNLYKRLKDDLVFSSDIPAEEREEIITKAEQAKPAMLASIKAKLGDTIFEAKADKIYKEYIDNKALTYTLPQNKATQILRKITDQFKGKYVFIDFWATSCGPCRSSIERSQEVLDSLRNHRDVAFVYITDAQQSPEKSYNEYVAKYLSKEHVFRLPHEDYELLRELFKFSGIPHYETLDRKGNVIRSNARWYTIESFLEILNGFKSKLD